MYDLIIIGAGPAGMTAAVYAARKRLNTLILTKDFGGQLMWTMDIENYMGYQLITGPELTAKYEEQVARHAVNSKYGEVTKLSCSDEGIFTVMTSDEEFYAKAVIIASGKRPRRLNVSGEAEFMGRGVSYCATCDGPFFVGKTVAVIGGGNSAVQAVIELSTLAATVYYVSRSGYKADAVLVDKLKGLTNIIEYVGYTTAKIEGTNKVERFFISNIVSREQTILDVDGVFVEIGLEPNSEYASELVTLNANKEIIVDCRANTLIPGLFAAGDVTNSHDKQIVIAAGDGAKAALAAYDYLLRKG